MLDATIALDHETDQPEVILSVDRETFPSVFFLVKERTQLHLFLKDCVKRGTNLKTYFTINIITVFL